MTRVTHSRASCSSTAARAWLTSSARARSTSIRRCRAATPARCSAARFATATGKRSADRSEARMKRIASVFLACAAIATGARAATPPADVWTIVQCGSALVTPGQAARGETTLVIHEQRIAEIQNGLVTPESIMNGKNGTSQLVDLRDKFCLPGLVDLHVHLTAEYTADVRLRRVTEDEAEVALRAAMYAKK